MASRRIGEASNPGPAAAAAASAAPAGAAAPQWGFDMPELGHELFEDELDRLDGVVGQADLGWVEAGFDADWAHASLPAEQAGYAVHDQAPFGATDVLEDLADRG